MSKGWVAADLWLWLNQENRPRPSLASGFRDGKRTHVGHYGLCFPNVRIMQWRLPFHVFLCTWTLRLHTGSGSSPPDPDGWRDTCIRNVSEVRLRDLPGWLGRDPAASTGFFWNIWLCRHPSGSSCPGRPRGAGTLVGYPSGAQPSPHPSQGTRHWTEKSSWWVTCFECSPSDPKIMSLVKTQTSCRRDKLLNFEPIESLGVTQELFYYPECKATSYNWEPEQYRECWCAGDEHPQGSTRPSGRTAPPPLSPPNTRTCPCSEVPWLGQEGHSGTARIWEERNSLGDECWTLNLIIISEMTVIHERYWNQKTLG